MKIVFSVQFYLSILVLDSSTSSPAAPLPGRFSLLARYIYPEECNECARMVENVSIIKLHIQTKHTLGKLFRFLHIVSLGF